MIAVSSGLICTAGTNYSVVTGTIGGTVATASLFKALTSATGGAIGEFAYVGGAGPTA